ncbi:MAG: hypothetical protein ACR2IE_09865 [Candidatus Sumerlaeaceae bacterium]
MPRAISARKPGIHGLREFLREDDRFSSGEITQLENLKYMSNSFKLPHPKLEYQLEKLENLKALVLDAALSQPAMIGKTLPIEAEYGRPKKLRV